MRDFGTINTGRKELRICFCFGSLVRQVMWRLRIALPWKHSTAAEMQSANCQFCCSHNYWVLEMA